VRQILKLLLLTGFFCSCSSVPTSQAYRQFYAHLEDQNRSFSTPSCIDSSYFIVFLVDARHLDYSNNRSFFQTVAKHPSDGSKTGDVGHAWVYLQGELNGQTVFIEGGHTGETGSLQARYFDGVMNYFDYGYPTPTPEQLSCPRYEPNPIKYLWEIQRDGYFQWGSGNHDPTFAARVELSEEQFNRALAFVEHYNYSEYALTGSQCSSFMAQIASVVGLDLECEVTIEIDPYVYIGGHPLRLREDVSYAQLTIATPDVLEKSLMEAVNKGQAIPALTWYNETHQRSFYTTFSAWKKNSLLFPKRLARYKQL
jgi:hypothetical protein